jgi:hypothetical protein
MEYISIGGNPYILKARIFLGWQPKEETSIHSHRIDGRKSKDCRLVPETAILATVIEFEDLVRRNAGVSRRNLAEAESLGGGGAAIDACRCIGKGDVGCKFSSMFSCLPVRPSLSVFC